MRNKRLDVLRCIAILLVIARHSTAPSLVEGLGWVGVDLFFVLSGFLISGLLFVEYKERGSIDVKRFYVRCGLKLYPSFYVFLAATFAAAWYLGRVRAAPQFLGELFYVQNYGPYIWSHTWSLAVEEHFYFVLPLLLLGLIWLSKDKRNPFRAVPWICFGLSVACLAVRVWMVARIPASHLHEWDTYRPAYVDTHTRVDSLFFGVLLGYLYHFHGHWQEWTKRHLRALVALALLLLSCAFVRLDSRFMLTAGFTMLYIGFGIVLVLTLSLRNVLPAGMRLPAEKIGGLLAYVGKHSYSIYLWHVPLRSYLPIAVSRLLHVEMGPRRTDLFYAPLTIAIGIAMSLLVEYPILRLRDRLLPSNHSAPVKVPAGERPAPLAMPSHVSS